MWSLSTDVREPRTATGSRMFPFSAWFYFSPRTGKALVDDCGLTLQTRWRENAQKREKFKFQLPSVAQKRLCLSSLMSQTWFLLDFLLALGKVHALLVSTSSLLKDSRTLLY